MKYIGKVSLKKATPQGMDYIATIEGMVTPINISIIGAKDLQPEGTITIELLRVGEKQAEAKPEIAAPVGMGGRIRGMIDKARGKALG